MRRDATRARFVGWPGRGPPKGGQLTALPSVVLLLLRVGLGVGLWFLILFLSMLRWGSCQLAHPLLYFVPGRALMDFRYGDRYEYRYRTVALA